MMFGAANLPWKWIGVGVAALVLLIAIPAFIDRAFDEAEEKGKIEGENEELRKTIEQKKEADDARDQITQPGPTGDRKRYDQCLRTARTPENCERFLPDIRED